MEIEIALLLDWLVIALAALIGMSIGTHFHEQVPRFIPKNFLKRLVETPEPRRSEDTDELILDSLDAIRQELSDLADRQEFTERLLSKGRAHDLIEGPATPV